MSDFVSPSEPSTSWKIGTSISTPLVVPSVSRTQGVCANPTTATSRMRASQVLGVGVEGRVRLAGRPEVVDVLHRRAPLLARLPHRLDPHAHPHVLGCDA